MKRRLRSKGDILHLRCACHIINLVVRDGIYEIEDRIEAIWHCVKFIRSSSSRLDKFRDFSVLEPLSNTANVPLYVITRWNSTYLMLAAALKYEKVFERMGYEDDAFKKYFDETDAKTKKKRAGAPSSQDWRNAQAFVHFLGKFYEATMKLSAWKKVTAHLLFSELIGLQTKIDSKMNDDRDPILQRVACGMKDKFDKYWGSFEQMNKIIVIANVLDPRWKLQYQKKAFAKVGSSPIRVATITSELKGILMMMYDEYRRSDAAFSQTTPVDGSQPMEEVEFQGVDGGQAEILADLMQERMDEQNEMISNEVDKYLADRYVHPLTPGFDGTAWWKVNANAYLVLSKLAKDVFSIPCSTVASENAFSLGKRVVDPYRSSLTPKMVECLVCSSDSLRDTTPNFYKEPTVAELE
ncbi:zinc finger BED domain-containing protein RICESLEEPER 2-like [Rosa chinensis]|uniref:zinc finger BED domain-containing protein RICESLEEPER 2-like n=1 Tax=Rosa chinensis TaxID=74649 RepID=UPI000D086FCB|nr:zinc finger BED domain-containing protein RICESLEEPER 2-like [Rosa chinensis]